MHQLSIRGLSLWQFEKLANESTIKHFVTDRQSNTADFTVGLNQDDVASALNNRSVLANAMGVNASSLYIPYQIHQTNILRVTHQTKPEALKGTDALITNERGACIAVMSADCVPILIYDKHNEAIAAVHAGWRGTVSYILEKTLNAMADEFGTTGRDVTACIGPSVCPELYQVGQDVIEAVNSSFGTMAGLIQPSQNNKSTYNLWEANILQLKNFGVLESNIEVANLCTIKNNNHFYSARKGDVGRFAAGIILI